MFGFRLIHKAEIKLWEERLADQKYMLDRMEAELHYWQKRADEERERADRTTDVVMQQNGLPDVTATVITEKKRVAEETKDIIAEREAEVKEMFAESFDEQDELNWIDPDLAEQARTWIDQAKKEREKKKNEVNVEVEE